MDAPSARPPQVPRSWHEAYPQDLPPPQQPQPQRAGIVTEEDRAILEGYDPSPARSAALEDRYNVGETRA